MIQIKIWFSRLNRSEVLFVKEFSLKGKRMERVLYCLDVYNNDKYMPLRMLDNIKIVLFP